MKPKDYDHLPSDVLVKLSETAQGVQYSESFRARMKEAVEFRSLLLTESDRGCALMASAYLDELLKRHLQHYLVLTSELKKTMFNFNGSLGTFSSRINMSYAIGKLPRSYQKDLHRIRDIRNIFAHSAEPMAFDTLAISKICAKLICHPHPKTKEPRQIFITVTMGIMGFLDNHFNFDAPFKALRDLDLNKINSDFTAHQKRAEELLNTLVVNKKGES